MFCITLIMLRSRQSYDSLRSNVVGIDSICRSAIRLFRALSARSSREASGRFTIISSLSLAVRSVTLASAPFVQAWPAAGQRTWGMAFGFTHKMGTVPTLNLLAMRCTELGKGGGAHLLRVRPMRVALVVLPLVLAGRAAAQHPEYFPEGCPRAFLEEIGRAELPDEAYKLVAVVGALKRPIDFSVRHQVSVFTMTPRAGLTVSQAIEAAGGFGDFGDARHVGVWKNESGTFLTIDVRAARKKEPLARDPVLEPGDIVVILQRRVNA